MYSIIELNTDTEKRKLILQKMTHLKHRELDIRDLQKIYLELLRVLNVSNKDSDIFEDVSKSLFIVSHYSQLANGKAILLESLYLCKLASMNNPYIKFKINKCINIVGSYTIDKELVNVVTTTFLVANRYLELMTTEVNKEMFLKFIKTTTTSNEFENTSFYITISIYLEENQTSSDKILLDLFDNLKLFLKSPQTMMNYCNFINWYFEQL